MQKQINHLHHTDKEDHVMSKISFIRTVGNERNQIIQVGQDYSIIRMMRRNGEVMDYTIDCENAERARKCNWFYHNGYAACSPGSKKFIDLQNYLFGIPEKGYMFHHVNHYRTDNRRDNLQVVTWSENNMLKPAQKNHSTNRQGISLYRNGRYVALIGPNGKRKSFRTYEEALKARVQYEEEVLKGIHERTARYFGELGYLCQLQLVVNV
jgi:hypothetical protein